MSAAWYAVMTLARAEAIANHYLRDAGYATLYLHYADTIRHARRSLDVLRPYFPRYVFVGLQNRAQGLFQAATATGVHSIVARAGAPLEVPERVIAELQARGDRTGRVEAEVVREGRRRFPVGASVRVAGGPLEGLLATVALDDGAEIRVWLAMFAGQIEAIFDPAQLQAATVGPG